MKKIKKSAEDRELDRIWKKLNKIGSEIGIRYTDWSITEVADNMDDIPFPKATSINYEVDDYWGRSCIMPIRENSTWKEIWETIDCLVQYSLDHHHRFIEDVRVEGKDETILTFSCGS